MLKLFTGSMGAGMSIEPPDLSNPEFFKTVEFINALSAGEKLLLVCCVGALAARHVSSMFRLSSGEVPVVTVKKKKCYGPKRGRWD